MFPLRHDLALDLISRQPTGSAPALLAGYLAAREASTLK
jgi:hypothetical protein